MRSAAAEAPRGGDDERLLIEAAKADPQRFAELYERNFDRVYAFAARRTSSRGEAEDLTAEVFHHALANLGRFEWRGIPFAAWLLQIARNSLADRWQRTARERGEPAPDPDEIASDADAEPCSPTSSAACRTISNRSSSPGSSSTGAFARSPWRSAGAREP